MLKLLFAHLFLILNLSIFAQQAVVTPTEANKLGNKIETAVNNGDTAFLHNLIDIKSFLRKIESKSVALKDAAVKRGFSESFKMAQFGDQTIALTKTGGCKMLKVYEKEGKLHLLFRVYGNGGFNYQDFALIKVQDIVKVEDMYSYVSGEELSTTLANALDMGFSSSDGKDEVSEDWKFIKEIGKLKKQKNYIGEKQLFEQLGTGLQNSKAIQLLYIDACKHISTDVYKAALDNYVSLFPNEANAYLMMLDVYYLDKEYDKAVTAVEKLDSLVGGDPYLLFYKGLLYKKSGKLDESRALFEKCFQAEPGIIANMQQLAYVYYEQGDQEKAKTIINSYKKIPSFKPEDLQPLYKVYPSLKDSL